MTDTSHSSRATAEQPPVNYIRKVVHKVKLSKRNTLLVDLVPKLASLQNQLPFIPVFGPDEPNASDADQEMTDQEIAEARIMDQFPNPPDELDAVCTIDRALGAAISTFVITVRAPSTNPDSVDAIKSSLKAIKYELAKLRKLETYKIAPLERHQALNTTADEIVELIDAINPLPAAPIKRNIAEAHHAFGIIRKGTSASAAL